MITHIINFQKHSFLIALFKPFNCHLSSSSSTETNVRVRFAPSPTGYLHLGGLRTALINFLFAKSNNGVFILRIEDTDQTRKVEGAIEKLEDDLNWVGISIDEGPSQGGKYGPYLQSQRLDIYRKEVDNLVNSNHAYPCFCSNRRLDIIRKDALRRREIPKYDNRCRVLTKEEVNKKLESEIQHCIRFKLTPLTSPWHDLIHGPILRNICEIEGDPVILKTDGYPTYHLANVVDDHYMKISHVMRGLEWQTSTPKHILLYQAFNWKPPKYAHLPLLINEDGSKLSKRHSDVTVEAYKNAHIYSKTLVNVLTMCGGGFVGRENPDDTGRLLTLEELKQKFSIDLINTYSCQLPLNRIKDFNLMELKQLVMDEDSLAKLIRDTREIVAKKLPESKQVLSSERIKQILQWCISNGRISSLPQLLENDFLFLWQQPSKKVILEFNKKLFELIPPLIEYLENSNEIQQSEFTDYLKHLSREKEFEYPLVMKFLRATLSGLQNGPSVWEITVQLGKEETVNRLQQAQSLCYSDIKEVMS